MAGHVPTRIPTSCWKVWVASHWWGGMECQEHFSWHLWYQLASIDWEIGQNRYIYITGLMCQMCDGGPAECNHPYGWSSVHSSNALYCCMWNSSCQGNRRLCIVVPQKAQQSYRPLATPLAQYIWLDLQRSCLTVTSTPFLQMFLNNKTSNSSSCSWIWFLDHFCQWWCKASQS